MTFILTLLLAPLVAGLGSDDFARREACQRTLQRLSWLAHPALERARRSSDPEVAWRATKALDALQKPVRPLFVSTYHLPGWCDDHTARYYATEERWVRLFVEGVEVGAIGEKEHPPWPGYDYTMSREDQVRALVNYGRSQVRGDGRLTWSMPWSLMVHPDGEPMPAPPRGTKVLGDRQ